MDENKDVKQAEEPSTPEKEPVQAQPVAPSVEPEEPQKPPKGYVPYEALNEERDKRKQLETELEELRSTPSEVQEDEVFTDEGKVLGKKISDLKEEVTSLKRDSMLEKLQEKHPELKDKAEEFKDFRDNSENKGMSIQTAAKAFLIEKGLLANQPERKGLEKPTGGGQVTPEPTYTKEAIEDMMKNNYPLYEKLVREGKI